MGVWWSAVRGSQSRSISPLIHVEANAGNLRQLVLSGVGSAWIGERAHLSQKLSLLGSVSIAVCKSLQDVSEVQRASLINRLIQMEKPDVIYIHSEWKEVLTAKVVQAIDAAACRVFLAFDDNMFHESNREVARHCDLVAMADPLQRLRYETYGMSTVSFSLEASRHDFYPVEVNQDIPVLFYGRLDSQRLSLLADINDSLVSTSVMTHQRSSSFTTKDLRQLISRSKIVLNLSGLPTDIVSGRPSATPPPFESVLGYKNRPVEAALCNRLCVSEYSPSLSLAFPNGRLPMFRGPAEAAQIIEDLLADSDRVASLAQSLHEYTLVTFENEAETAILRTAIEACL